MGRSRHSWFSFRNGAPFSRLAWSVLLSSGLLGAGQAMAQKATLPGVSSYLYRGVGSASGRMYYLLHAKQAMTPTFYLQLFDENLRALPPTEIKLDSVADVEGAIDNGDRCFLYFSNNKQGLLLAFDHQGKEVTRATFDAPSRSENKVRLFPWHEKGLLSVRPFEGKKTGFRIEAFDADLKSAWQKDYIPEKGDLKILSLQVSGNRMVVLTEGKKDLREVIELDLDGKEIFRTPIVTEAVNIFPTHVAVADDGAAGVFGGYSTKEFIKAGIKHHQYFLATFSPTGQQTSLEYAQWPEDVAAKVRSHSSVKAWSEEQPDIYFHQMTATADGFRLLGETYRFEVPETAAPAASNVSISIVSRKSAARPAPSPAGSAGSAGSMRSMDKPLYFYAMDLVAVDIDRQGHVQKVRRIAKPAMQTESSSTVGVPVHPEHELAEYDGIKRFGYRFSVPGSSGDEYVVANEQYGLAETSFIAANDSIDNPLKRDYTNALVNYGYTAPGSERPIGSMQQDRAAPPTGPGQELNVRKYAQFGGYEQNHEFAYVNILPAASGGYVFAHYDGHDLVLEKRARPKNDSGLELAGWSSVASSAFGPFPGGGEYALQRFEFGEDGNDHFGLVLADKAGGAIVTRRLLNLPMQAVARIPNGDNLLVIHRNATADVIASLGPRGVLEETKEIPHAKQHGRPTPEGSIYVPGTEGDFYRIQPFEIDEKNAGYQVLRLDNSLASHFDVAEKVTFEDKGSSLRVAGGAVSGNLLAVWEERSWMEKSRSRQADRLSFFDREGRRSGQVELVVDSTWLAPDLLTNSGMAGVWFEEKKDELEARGLFLQPLAPRTQATKLAWTEVAGALGDPRFAELLTAGKLRLRPLELVTVKEQTLLLMDAVFSRDPAKGLGYRSSEGSHTDFAVLQMDKTGHLTGGYLIPALPGPTVQAPHFRYLEGDSASGYNLVFDAVAEDLPVVFSTTLAKSDSRKYAAASAFIPAEPTATPAKPSNFVTQFQAGFEGTVDRFEKAIGTNRPPPSYRPDPNVGFARAAKQHIAVYRYDPQKRLLNWEDRKLE